MRKLTLERRRTLVGEYCVREARPVGRSNKMTLRQLPCNRSAAGHTSLQTSVTLCCIGCHPPRSLFKCHIYRIKQECNAAHVNCPPMVQSQQRINVSTFVAVHILGDAIVPYCDMCIMRGAVLQSLDEYFGSDQPLSEGDQFLKQYVVNKVNFVTLV